MFEAMALTAVSPFDSVERPLARLRVAIEQAERELSCLRKAYLEARDSALEPILPARDPGQPQALSRQEIRVAARLAGGMSNLDIATAMHLSLHTVKSHVRSILRKRGLRSRWQLSGQ